MKKYLLFRKLLTLTSAVGILFSFGASTIIKTHAMVAVDSNNTYYDPHETTASTSQLRSGDYYYELMPNNSVKIDLYAGSDTELVLPDIIDGKKVSTLGTKMFFNSNIRDSITKVVVPEGVTDIDGAAFFGCSSLTNISLPSTLQEIRYGAFYNCAALSNITIPASLTKIGAGAFKGTKWLSERINENPIVVVNGVLIDGSQCTGDVMIPDNVTTIANAAIPSSDNISSVTVPKSVSNLGNLGFGGEFVLSDSGEMTASVRTALDNFSIYCYKDSAAEQYAVENELTYEILDDPVIMDSSVTDSAESLSDGSEPDELLNSSSSEIITSVSEIGSTLTDKSDTKDESSKAADDKADNNTIYIVLIISIFTLAAVIVICTVVNVKKKK
jgi:hypothetical protein